MTSVPESATSILVTCQQTRFHLLEDSASKEIDVKGLSIVLSTESSVQSGKFARKSKAQKEGLEILANAELKLKTGIHYALVGRNGTGKSTLLRALAQKLIPGIPLNTRIALLQQTAETDGVTIENTVLQQVVNGDPYRNTILREVEVLSKALEESESLAAVRALRQVKHWRLETEFFEVQKDAKLRSGARGFDARKILIEYEKKYDDSLAKLDADISNESLQKETKEAVDLHAELISQMEAMGKEADVETKACRVLAGLGFKEPQLDQKFSTLSGGWKMRCLLGCALTQTSDILILDEPTNYLDLLGILWLQKFVSSLETDTIVVIVSHDRDFIDTTCSETIILKEQKLTYYNGTYSSYEKSIRHQILRMTRMKDAQDKQIAHTKKTIADSLKHGKASGDDNRLKLAKSRQKKLDERTGMQVSAKGGRWKLNRDLAGFHNNTRAEIEVPKEERGVYMSFPDAPDLRFPGSLVSLEKVTFAYPRCKPVLNEIDLVIHSEDRIGILGLNGSGKSHLIRLLVDEQKPSKGTSTRHPRLRIGYYSQHAVEALQELGRSELSLTALGLLTRIAIETGVDIQEQDIRGLLGSLGLPGHLASAVPVVKLSGGQLVRLELAKIFLSQPHILILDEPTTHLDLPTVFGLTQALKEYTGAIVLVSHDRFLVRCVC